MKCCFVLDEDDSKEFVLKYLGYLEKIDKSINIDDFILSNLKNNDEYDYHYLKRCKSVIEKLVKDVDDELQYRIDHMYDYEDYEEDYE